jgi:hypothetical protein
LGELIAKDQVKVAAFFPGGGSQMEWGKGFNDAVGF